MDGLRLKCMCVCESETLRERDCARARLSESEIRSELVKRKSGGRGESQSRKGIERVRAVKIFFLCVPYIVIKRHLDIPVISYWFSPTHVLQLNVLENHKYELIKLIILEYLEVKLKYEGKKNRSI